MFVEYDLQSDMGEFKGIFDTEGFWVQRKEEDDDEGVIYKIWGAFNFAFATREWMLYDAVYDGLTAILGGLSTCVVVKDKARKSLCHITVLTPEQVRPMLHWQEFDGYCGWIAEDHSSRTTLVYKFPEIEGKE